MKQNARYEGGSGTGVDLTVLLVDGQQRPRHVDQGEALPTEIADAAVDPEFVERLLEQGDWQPTDPHAYYEAMTVDELTPLAADLEIEGTGADGNILKKDLVDGLTAAHPTVAADPIEDNDDDNDDNEGGTS